jgi:hypothetical protein
MIVIHLRDVPPAHRSASAPGGLRAFAAGPRQRRQRGQPMSWSAALWRPRLPERKPQLLCITPIALRFTWLGSLIGRKRLRKRRVKHHPTPRRQNSTTASLGCSGLETMPKNFADVFRHRGRSASLRHGSRNGRRGGRRTTSKPKAGRKSH